MNKTLIGFDLDKIFVNHPPIIPDKLIERVYKKKNGELMYRIPGKIERKVRILSHFPIFRHPITENITELKKLFSHNIKPVLITSRFSFLDNRTAAWLRKHNLNKYFDQIHINLADQQPHIFKNEMLKKLKITHFVDDDLDLLKYVAQKNPQINFFWLDKNAKNLHKDLPKNITPLTSLQEFYTFLFKK